MLVQVPRRDLDNHQSLTKANTHFHSPMKCVWCGGGGSDHCQKRLRFFTFVIFVRNVNEEGLILHIIYLENIM